MSKILLTVLLLFQLSACDTWAELRRAGSVSAKPSDFCVRKSISSLGLKYSENKNSIGEILYLRSFNYNGVGHFTIAFKDNKNSINYTNNGFTPFVGGFSARETEEKYYSLMEDTMEDLENVISSSCGVKFNNLINKRDLP